MTWFVSANTASSSGQAAAIATARIGLFTLGSRSNASGAVVPMSSYASEQAAHWTARIRGYRGSTSVWDSQVSSASGKQVPLSVKAIVVSVGTRIPWHLFLCLDLP